MLKKLLFSMFFLISFAQAFAQNEHSIDTLLSNIKNRYPVNPLEKAYLSIDRKFYLPGDTIWMSGFILGPQNISIGLSSRILNIELRNARGVVVSKQRLLMKDGIGYGQLPILHGLVTGNYRLNASVELVETSGNQPVFSTAIFIGTEKTIADRGYSTKVQPNLSKKQVSSYNIEIEKNRDSIRVILQAAKDVLNGEKLFLVPIADQKALFVFPTRFPDEKITLDIPKAKLPDGLIWFALFRANGTLLAKKAVFCPAARSNKIQIFGLQKSYPLNQQLKLPLEVLGKEGRPIEGTFAISVSKADSSKLNFGVSEIEKKIFFGRYLNNNTLDHDYNATELELVSEQQVETPFFSKQPALKEGFPETGIPIRGTVKKKGKALAGAKVSLIIGNLSNGMFADDVSDNQGKFSFSVPDSLVFTPMRLQLNGDKEGSEIVPDSISTLLGGSLLVSAPQNGNHFSQASGIMDQKSLSPSKQEGIKLNTITIKGQKEAYKSTNLNGSGNADVVIGPEVLEKMPDLGTLDVLLPGTQMIGGGKALRLRSGVGSHSPNVLVLINGADGGDLNTISPRDIAQIEFMKSPAYAGIYGIRGSGGVLLITTKNGRETPSKTDHKAVLEIEFPAAYAAVFKYNTKPTGPTVFWAPQLKTDWAGRGEIAFNTGLLSGNYIISIEGIGSKGEICAQQFIYKVE
jgi:hypothetical protein